MSNSVIPMYVKHRVFNSQISTCVVTDHKKMWPPRSTKHYYCLIPSRLSNAGTWLEMTEKAVSMLENIQDTFARVLLALPVSTPRATSQPPGRPGPSGRKVDGLRGQATPCPGNQKARGGRAGQRSPRRADRHGLAGTGQGGLHHYISIWDQR